MMYRMNRTPPPAADDVLCEVCGYTLNGLPTTGNCPECGTPVARSTTESPRRPPAWETGHGTPASRFNRTASFVARHPGLFGQRVSITSDTTRSQKFALYTLLLTAYLNAKTVVVHFTLIGALSLTQPLMLLTTAVIAAVASFGFWRTTLQLVAWLTSLEGGFWGHRMPRPRVLRLLHYLSVHLVIVSALPLLATTAAAIAFAFNKDIGLFAVQYLYGLCAVMVIAAVYLFKMYWSTMKAVLYANDDRAIAAAAKGNPA